jgi:hypothetical protein
MSKRTEDLGTYQMLWDCPYCGTEKLLGLDHRHCPGCGSPQDPERRYFPSEEDKVLVQDHRYTGADRVCGACETPMPTAAEFCTSCGSPMTEAAAAKTRKDKVLAEGEATVDSAKAARDEFAGKTDTPKMAPPVQKSGKGKFIGVAVLLLLIVVCGFGAVMMFWTKDAPVKVIGHTWERTITVENYESVRESDWKEDVPSGATDVSCKKEKRGSKKVKDGETCKTRKKDQGDGTYKEVKECEPKYRSEPTYDQKCSYKVKKWTDGKTHRASGTTKDSVKWPSVKTSGSKQREGKKTETYTLKLSEVSGGKKHDCDVPLKTWKKLDKGDKVSAKKRAMTGGLDCSSVR